MVRSRSGPGRARRRRRWPSAAVCSLAVLVLVADVAVITLRDRATPVTLEDAVERFREEVTATEDGPAAPRQTANPAGVASPPTAGPGTTAPSEPDEAGSPTASTSLAEDLRPANGVYRYRTAGGEEVPFINASRSYPSETTATVVRGRGCGWNLRVDLLAEHTDSYDMCSTAEGLAVPGLTITIEWFLIRRSISLTCYPAIPLVVVGAPAGVARTSRCSGDDISTAMRVTDQGTADVRVGATTVRAMKVAMHMDISGMFAGGADYELWLEPSSGLLLRIRRSVDAEGQTPLGRQRYLEHHDSTLLDLTPST